MKEKINVTRTSLPPFEEYCSEIREFWDSRILTNMGEEHEAFRAALSGGPARRPVHQRAPGPRSGAGRLPAARRRGSDHHAPEFRLHDARHRA